VELLVLGPLEVQAGGVGVVIRRGRPRRLLLGLVLRRGVAVSTDVLIEELWGDDPPLNAPNALQILVSYLRKTLAPVPSIVLETVPGGYRLAIDDDRLAGRRGPAGC